MFGHRSSPRSEAQELRREQRASGSAPWNVRLTPSSVNGLIQTRRTMAISSIIDAGIDAAIDFRPWWLALGRPVSWRVQPDTELGSGPMINPWWARRTAPEPTLSFAGTVATTYSRTYPVGAAWLHSEPGSLRIRSPGPMADATPANACGGVDSRHLEDEPTCRPPLVHWRHRDERWSHRA